MELKTQFDDFLNRHRKLVHTSVSYGVSERKTQTAWVCILWYVFDNFMLSFLVTTWTSEVKELLFTCIMKTDLN